ncbi:MAG: glycosyltransferase [Butyrivibrio sp.]|nr:glycosyltransferase [Butyrivibrio sp.]
MTFWSEAKKERGYILAEKVSIIIPAYNIEDLLERCVKSLVNQTYPADKLEIIVVDDGSGDSTGEIADKLAAEHENVFAYHQKNAGSSAARNNGLSHATGSFVGFVDSDDFVDEHMVEALMDVIDEFDVPMAQVCRDEIAEDGTKLPDVVIPPSKTILVKNTDYIRTLLMHTGDASYCTRITKKTLFTDKLKFPQGVLNEDFWLLIQMLENIDKVAILPYQYYHVFYRSGSNSRKKAADKDYFPPVFTDIVNHADFALELMKKNHPDMVEVAERFGYVQRLDYLLHIPISKMTSDNKFYKENVVGYLRKHKKDIAANPYLSDRDKKYLKILMPAPRLVRFAHAKVKGL